jgi:hypothetical protein
VWHFGAAESAAGRRGRTASKGEGAWHFGATQCCAGCRRADGPIEPPTHTSCPTSDCLCAGIRSTFTNEVRKHTNHNSRVYFLWSLTPELTGAGGPIGPQGTNIGHQNREAMANVGVRVERFVRLGSVGRIGQVKSKLVRFEYPQKSSKRIILLAEVAEVHRCKPSTHAGKKLNPRFLHRWCSQKYCSW